MITDSSELKKIEAASASFMRDSLVSAAYFTTKCLGAVGGVFTSAHCLNDLATGKYLDASLKGAMVAGCYGVYRFMDKREEVVNRRAAKTSAYLEEKYREGY